MLHITNWFPESIHQITYGLAEGTGSIGIAQLDVTRATLMSLPEGLDALRIEEGTANESYGGDSTHHQCPTSFGK
jgi:hypothetical protein